MEIVRELCRIPDLSAAFGFFDGLHIGHRSVIDGAIDFAKTNDLKSAIITFKEHPYCYLKGVAPKYILSQQDKYEILERVGIDYIIELDFESVANMTPDVYMSEIIEKYYSPKAIFSGFNHHFGVDKSGDVKFLTDNQDKYGYIYFPTPATTLYGAVISSTTIRNYIANSYFDVAAEMLGRRFYVKGTIVEGQKFGREIGCPTINMKYPDDIIQPSYGVYKTILEFENGDIYHGMSNFGVHPTVGKLDKPVLETHLINYNRNEDLYGQNIKVTFFTKIRPEIKFAGIEELKSQIQFDLEMFS